MVIPLSSSFRVHSEDPAFHVSWRGGSRFILSGEVTMSPSAELDVATPHDEVEVSLATHSTPTHAVSALRRALPRGIVMQHTAVADGVELVFNEALVPAAKPPHLRLFTAGVHLDVKQLAENSIEFNSSIREDVIVTILCDSRRASVKLTAGLPAHTAATLIGGNMPRGFRAIVDGATVTVWKDADFFSAVA